MDEPDRPWEKSFGDNVQDRVRYYGRESVSFRTKQNLPAQEDILFKRFYDSVHKIGADILQLQLTDDKIADLEYQALERKQQKNARILRGKVQISTLEDGTISVRMDQDWNTSSWTMEMIEAGCDAILSMFHTSESDCPLDKKDRAVMMLQKLVSRHKEGEAYIRRNMEMMIGKAANRLIRNGRSAGLLDLMYILDGCKEKYYDDLSRFNFTGRAHEMMLLEARLAAILIQTAFRARRERIRPKRQEHFFAGYGDPAEFDKLREAVVNKRAKALKTMWHRMHCKQDKATRMSHYGLHGPAHVGIQYTQLTLKIIHQLVCEKAIGRATGNREDVVRANGIILLSNFLSCPNGPFADNSIQVLKHIAKAAESFPPMLHMKTTYACYKYLVFIKSKLDLYSADIFVDKAHPSYKQANHYRHLFIDAMLTLTRMGVHASGIFRARCGYGYMKAERADAESVDYKTILKFNWNMLHSECIIKLMGIQDLFRLVAVSIIDCRNTTLMQFLLRCFYSLSTSECYHFCLHEITNYSATLMKRLIELIEEQDLVVGTLATALFVQLATRQRGRTSMLDKGMSKLLSPLTRVQPNYSKFAYVRSVITATALSRVVDFRAYDPQDTPVNFADSEFIRKAIYLDFLKTMKNLPLELSDMQTISDLIVRPTDNGTSLQMSKNAEFINPLDFSHFFVHPHEEKYFCKLPLNESCAACVILEGISMSIPTARIMFDVPTVCYLGQCLQTAKEILSSTSSPLKEGELMILLHGVASAANALANMSLSAIGYEVQQNMLIEGVQLSQLMHSSCFFIDSMSVEHPDLDEGLHQLQVYTGMSVIRFFDTFAALILSMEKQTIKSDGTLSVVSDPRVIDLMSTLSGAGSSVSHLIKSLRRIYGDGDAMVDMLDKMCILLEKLTVPVTGASSALKTWNIIEALKEHLPPSLSAIGDFGADDFLYKEGLAKMPPSLFLLCGNLCQVESGKASILTEGFLRRSLEKLILESSKLESKDVLLQWKTFRMSTTSANMHLMSTRTQQDINLNQSQDCPPPSLSRRVCIASLRIVERIAGFNHKRFGSANDLIMSAEFPVIQFCSNILSDDLCPRDDELIVAAVKAWAALSFDETNSYIQFEKVDVIDIVGHELYRFCEYSLLCIRSYVILINNLFLGYRTAYMVRNKDTLREILSRIVISYPGLSFVIQDCLWSMSKAGIGSGAVFVVEDEFEEFYRTGKFKKVEESTVEKNSQLGEFASKLLDNKDMSIAYDSKLGNDDSQSLHSSDGKHTLEEGIPFASTSLSLLTSSLISTENLPPKNIDRNTYQRQLLSQSIDNGKPIHNKGLRDISKLNPNEFKKLQILKSSANNKTQSLHRSQSWTEDSVQKLPTLSSSSSHRLLMQNSSTHSISKSKSQSKSQLNSASSISLPSAPLKTIDLADCPELRSTKPPSILVLKKQ